LLVLDVGYGKPDHRVEKVRNKFRNTNVARKFISGVARNVSVFVCIGGDSSPTSVHESPLKRTWLESVSTDLHVLSRGFIFGGIVIPSGMETQPSR